MAPTWVDSDGSEVGEYEATNSYQDYCFTGKFTASSSYTCNRLGIYSHADPGNDPDVYLAVYPDSGGAPTGSIISGSKTSAININGGSQFFDGECSGFSVVSGNVYHVAHIHENLAPTTQWRYRNPTPANGGSHYTNSGFTYPTFPTAPSSGPSTRRYGAYRMGYEAVTTYKLEGVTKNNAGSVLGNCKCHLFKMNVTGNDASWIAYDESDASGNYSFTGLTDNDGRYFVIAWKDNTPHVFDCTDHVLTPVVE
jgi:hypothetical protein